MTVPNSPDSCFSDLKIGVNPSALALAVKEYLSTASAADALALRDLGVHHWAHLAASSDFGGHGVLSLTTERHANKEDRTYTVAPYPVGSVPKPLRHAFTSPYPGHVLIDLDWKASHWQILAFKAGDEALIKDLRSGDLYTALFPKLDRKVAKAALATRLNGGGLASLTETLGSEASAQEFLTQSDALFADRWPKAKAMIESLRREAVDQGWVSADRAYAGAGVALMRLEAEALRTACANSKLAELGVKVVLPLHDGVLVSAPAEKAEEAKMGLSRLMVRLSTGSQEEAKNSAGTWVSAKISSSWTGSTPQLVGHELRAAALKACGSENPADLALAASAMPSDLQAAAKALHPATAAAKAIRAAFSAHQAAVQWARASQRRHAEAPAIPTVELPHQEASYTSLCRILREDTAVPTPRWNARESALYIGDAEASDSLIRQTYLPALEERYGFRTVASAAVMEAAVDVARDQEFDPVKNYFNELKWDGVERLSTWLHDYAQAEDLAEDDAGKGLVRVYGMKWMLSIVARAFDPGCKVDTMLVLMGAQGARKSSLLRLLAPCGSFADVRIDPDDKDSVLRASRAAIVEWPELAGASRREQEALKAYFSLQEDRVRPPYARGDIKIPRRTVFCATTNEDDFLRDTTGSRRYWPVRVGSIDLDGLGKVKDQLWAEAVDLYRFLKAQDASHIWWLDEAQDAERARQAAHFTSEDPLQGRILSILRACGGRVTVEEVLEKMDVKPEARKNLARTVAQVLKALGCASKTVKESGVAVRKWVHPTITAPSLANSTTNSGDLEFLN